MRDHLPRALALSVRFAAVAALVLATACDGPPPPPPGPPTNKAATAKAVDETRIRSADGRTWRKLEHDGLHDPDNPALQYLQQPADALSVLPKGGPDGNQVDWIQALRTGAIDPRTNVLPETKIRTLDLDIVFTETAGQLNVVFPHLPHTEWLDCENCHPKIFIAKRGANKFGMFDVLQGDYCGQCHGAVAFPLTECQRCHSRPWQ